jgi:hypothetical protein
VTPFPWVADNGSLRSPAATLTKGVLYRLSYISLKPVCQLPPRRGHPVTPFPWVADNGSLRSPAATLTKGVLYRLSYISPSKKLCANLPCLPRVFLSIVTRTGLFLRTRREQDAQGKTTQQNHHQPTYLARLHCFPGQDCQPGEKQDRHPSTTFTHQELHLVSP